MKKATSVSCTSLLSSYHVLLMASLERILGPSRNVAKAKRMPFTQLRLSRSVPRDKGTWVRL